MQMSPHAIIKHKGGSGRWVEGTWIGSFFIQLTRCDPPQGAADLGALGLFTCSGAVGSHSRPMPWLIRALTVLPPPGSYNIIVMPICGSRWICLRHLESKCANPTIRAGANLQISSHETRCLAENTWMGPHNSPARDNTGSIA